MNRSLHAASVLDNWASALRGNWADIDGRSCRAQLDEIAAYLRGNRDTLTNQDVGVCMIGSPHWDEGKFPWLHEGVCESERS